MWAFLKLMSCVLLCVFVHKTFRPCLPSCPYTWNVPLILVYSFIPSQGQNATPSLSCVQDLRPRPENEASGNNGFWGAIGVSILKIQLKVGHMVMFHEFCKRKEWSDEERKGIKEGGWGLSSKEELSTDCK